MASCDSAILHLGSARSRGLSVPSLWCGILLWPVLFDVSVPVALWYCWRPWCSSLQEFVVLCRATVAQSFTSGGHLAVAPVLIVVAAGRATTRDEMHKALQRRWRGFFAIESKARTLCQHRKELRHPQVQSQMRETINCNVNIRRWYPPAMKHIRRRAAYHVANGGKGSHPPAAQSFGERQAGRRGKLLILRSVRVLARDKGHRSRTNVGKREI